MIFAAGWTGERFCYLTTRGRVTGRDHQIELWFAAHGDIVYMLAGGGEAADWVANIKQDPAVRLRIGVVETPARARIVTDQAEAALIRRIVPGKYAVEEDGLSEWAAAAAPVAVEWR